MSSQTLNEINWDSILCQMQTKSGQSLPVYPGNLKAALLEHAGISHHPQSEAVYQLAEEIARSTTYCDPEIAYWFSRLVPLIKS